MDGHPSLFRLSSLCNECPFYETCGAADTKYACPEIWPADKPGGGDVSHPSKSETIRELEELGGPEFDTVRALARVNLDLQAYTPQARNRRALKGYLHGDAYMLRASDVVRKHGVLRAAELRERLGLAPSVRLYLLMFDRDKLLEQIWTRGLDLIKQIAGAGYAAVISPSFSTYTPRPATEFMINSKRSLLYFVALQKHGVRAIPRVAWITSKDAIRFGIWIRENALIEAVAIDLSTYRRAEDWREQMEGLELFDRLTDEKLTYLVNGATTEQRCLDLIALLGADRVRITNATTQARIQSRPLRSTGNQTGVSFSARLEKRQGAVESATSRFEREERKVRAVA